MPVKLNYNKKYDRLELEFYFQFGLIRSSPSENMRVGEIETSVLVSCFVKLRFNSPECELLPAFPQSKASLQVKFLKSWMTSSDLYESLSISSYIKPYSMLFYYKKPYSCLGKQKFSRWEIIRNWSVLINKYLLIFTEYVDIVLDIGIYLLANDD